MKITPHRNPRIQRFSEVFKIPREAEKDLLNSVGIEFRKQMRTHFATDGASGGLRWPALKDATIDAKKRKGQSLRILRATKRLWHSLTRQGHPDYVQRIARKGKGKVIRLGTGVGYASYHFDGEGNLPRRPPINFTEAGKMRMRDAVIRGLKPYLRRQVKLMQAWKGLKR